MLESLKIEGFRKYKELHIDGFQRINFIMGNNNVGKTSILEAIYAWACGQNVVPFLSVPLARGRYSAIQQPYWLMEEILAVVNDRYSLPLSMIFEGIESGELKRFEHTIYPSDLLKEYNASYKTFADGIIPRFNDINGNSGVNGGYPYLTGSYNTAVVAKWNVKYKEDIIEYNFTVPMLQVPEVKPCYPAKFVDLLTHTAVVENVQIYSSLKRENRLDEVVEEISKVYSEIKDFDMLPYPDGSQAPLSIIKNDGTILPMYAYGDGIQRWFYILGAMTLYRNSIICIDEIDTGFHPNAQVEFCKHLIQYAYKNNVQLFITTHNIEFMDNFLEAAENIDSVQNEGVRIFTLRENKEFVFRALNVNEARRAREEFKLELR